MKRHFLMEIPWKFTGKTLSDYLDNPRKGSWGRPRSWLRIMNNSDQGVCWDTVCVEIVLYGSLSSEGYQVELERVPD
jgi:hypothetical protein